MQKVLIIGSGGAGKSTLAVRLGELLGLPVIHLDTLYWKPGWEATPQDDWKRIIAEMVQRERWIMDGNYGGTLEERLKACDTVIFLAFSRLICLCRVFKRVAIYRGRSRPDLNPGCPEQLPDREFLSWIWSYPRKRMPKILETLKALEGQKKIFILKSPSEARRFIDTIGQQATAQR
ncbi:MAG: DNA topology modulation protein [Candidatus Latescibacteria bacterium]|nr:DNA topology modulation protein [Candidatus Latescibacterota bacterium]